MRFLFIATLLFVAGAGCVFAEVAPPLAPGNKFGASIKQGRGKARSRLGRSELRADVGSRDAYDRAAMVAHV